MYSDTVSLSNEPFKEITPVVSLMTNKLCLLVAKIINIYQINKVTINETKQH